jgi:hypothetical protein
MNPSTDCHQITELYGCGWLSVGQKGGLATTEEGSG